LANTPMTELAKLRGENVYIREVNISDQGTALTTGTGKYSFRAPFPFTLLGVRIFAATAPTGAALLVDLNKNGTTVFGAQKLQIDISEKTSLTAALNPVIADELIGDDAELSFDIDQIGSTIAGAGLRAVIYGLRL
jgi:hypothetical protein